MLISKLYDGGQNKTFWWKAWQNALRVMMKDVRLDLSVYEV